MNPDLKKLPEKIRDLILSDELMGITEKIAAAHNLRPEYYGALFRITVKILKGTLEINGFMDQLIYQLDTDRETAVAIAQEINRDVFLDVKEELLQLHQLTPTPAIGAVPAAFEPAVSRKTGPSSFAVEDAPVASPYVVTEPSMSAVPTARGVVPPAAPSPLMASLDIAAMKALIAPAVPAIPVPQAPPVPTPIPQEPMRTITMDDTRTPIAPKPAVTAPPLQAIQGMATPEQPSMNIFEEKLGAAFRMKSEQLVPTPNYTSAVVPATPANPVPPVAPPAPTVPVAAVVQPTLEAAYVPAYVPLPPPRTSPQPMIGVVPAPAVPLSVPTRPQVVVPRPPLPQAAAPTLPIAPVVPSVQPAPMPTNAPVMPIPAVDPYRENV